MSSGLPCHKEKVAHVNNSLPLRVPFSATSTGSAVNKMTSSLSAFLAVSVMCLRYVSSGPRLPNSFSICKKQASTIEHK